MLSLLALSIACSSGLKVDVSGGSAAEQIPAEEEEAAGDSDTKGDTGGKTKPKPKPDLSGLKSKAQIFGVVYSKSAGAKDNLAKNVDVELLSVNQKTKQVTLVHATKSNNKGEYETGVVDVKNDTVLMVVAFDAEKVTIGQVIFPVATYLHLTTTAGLLRLRGDINKAITVATSAILSSGYHPSDLDASDFDDLEDAVEKILEKIGETATDGMSLPDLIDLVFNDEDFKAVLKDIFEDKNKLEDATNIFEEIDCALTHCTPFEDMMPADLQDLIGLASAVPVSGDGVAHLGPELVTDGQMVASDSGIKGPIKAIRFSLHRLSPTGDINGCYDFISNTITSTCPSSVTIPISNETWSKIVSTGALAHNDDYSFLVEALSNSGVARAVRDYPFRWLASGPTATLADLPGDFTNADALAVTVAGDGVAKYRSKFGPFASTDCTVETGYSAAADVAALLTSDLTLHVDGLMTLCVQGIDLVGNVQSPATEVSFTLDNLPPSVDAGVDANIVGTASLDGTISDLNPIATIAWTKISGPGEVNFTTGAAADTQFSGTVDGAYVLQLAATDVAGNTTTDTMVLTWTSVLPVVTIDALPDATYANEDAYPVSGACTEPGLAVDVTVSDGTSPLAPASPICSVGNTWSTTFDVSSYGYVAVTVTADHDDAQGNMAVQATTTFDKVNVGPTITSGATANVAENATAVFTATATDPELEAMTWTIVGGDDALLFSITAAGIITFDAAPDFETPGSAATSNVYDLDIQVTDATNTTTQTLTITVTDVNEAPTFTSSATPSMAENETEALTATVSDPESGSMTWSISGGADQALFAINSSTGVLSFSAAPNFEAPGDTDTDNVYVVEINANDGANDVPETVSVTVTNVNEAPTITSSATVNAAENQSAVVTAAATDPELNTVTWSITGGADQALFSIDANSGALTFQAAPDFEVPADADTDNEYLVEINANDGTSDTAQTVAVTVTDVNEAPTFTSSAAVNVAEGATTVVTAAVTDPESNTITWSITAGADQALFAIDEDTGALTFLAGQDFETPADADLDNAYVVEVTANDGTNNTAQTITATVTGVDDAPSITSNASQTAAESQTTVFTATFDDPESGAVTWSISGGDDALLFSIDANTGALTFAAAPDFEAPGDADTDNAYIVEITADDGPNATPQTVTVSVTDVNESPTVTSGATASVAENATAVLTAAASDPENATITWAVTGGADAALFNIDTNSGALTFAAGPDFETPADTDSDNDYIVQITADDGTNTTDHTVTVTVTAANEPATVSSSATPSAAENQTAVLTATATDPETDTVTWTITGGADQALFTIVGATGVLTFNAAPNFEAPADDDTDNVYEIEITGNDGNSNDTPQTVTITVTDVNEAPTFTSSATVVMFENNTTVQTAAVTDPENDTMTWSVSGGADAALFSIDSSSGELTFDAMPDFEIPSDSDTDNDYIVQVNAFDGANNVAQTVTITINDGSEAPTFTSATTANVAENTTAVLTVTATDPESDDLDWSVSGGADSALFSIDIDSGALTFAAAPDFETAADTDTNNAYIVEVNAFDGTSNVQQTVTVTVTNVDEAPTITSSATPSAAENQTGVLTAAADDQENDTIAWSITGGADQALFSIDGGTGVLTFLAAPNFDTPADADTNNTYIVEINANDGTNDTPQTVTVTVTDVNEDPTVTSSSTPNVAENTTAVLTATATDPESATVTWSISGGVDSAFFSIDTNTGDLTFDAAQDFEAPADSNTDNVYVVEINGNDGTNNVQQTVSVTVTDDNEAPSITSSATPSVAEGQTAVVTAAASDPETDTVTWSISGGADQALFGIDTNSGALTFNSAPDFETPGDSDTNNTYVVEVTANDGNSNTDVQVITATVTDDNEAPSVTSAATASVAENQTVVQTATATDPETDTVTWSITGGADQALFGIDTNTGALTFNAAPDFEAAADADTDNDYVVDVTANDGNGNTDTQTVTVTVTDVNEAPTVTSSATPSVVEGQTAVVSATATDPETDTVTWSITGGIDQALFGIDTNTGDLTFDSAPDFEAPGDNDTNNTYVVEITADDSNGHTVAQTVTVTVTGDNEAPSITSSATASAAENQTAVLSATATDPETDTIAWTISGGADQALFDIDGSSGALTFLTAPDFETAADADTNNDYIVEITADDGNSNTDIQTITVTVTDVNEAPAITSSSTPSAAENQTAVLTATATDPETDTVTWSITAGADQALFDIDTNSGVLTFLAAPDFEVPGDADTDNAYVVEITGDDGNAHTDVQTITVTVTDVNEAPTFTSNASQSMVENNTAVATATISDPENNAITWTIIGGTDDALFAIDADGDLSFLAAPDFELPSDSDTNNTYVVQINANDGVNDVPQTITVTVTDGSEAPTITSANSANVAENATAVLTATATDPELDDLTWSLTGGADQAFFAIDGDTGALTFQAAPDFETAADADTNNTYVVEINVSDGSGNVPQTVTVTVTNVDEAPSVTSSATPNAAENQTAVLTATADDPENDTIAWTITGGADQALFSIDSGTGVLSFLAAPDFDTPTDADTNNTYVVDINADDGTNDTPQTVTVTVTDVNEDATITSSDSPSIVENTTAVLTAAATDPESATVTWSISGGVDSAFFSIDTNSGALTFDAAPDYETPADSGPDNVYVVEINAHDGTNNTQQTVSVTVTDDNEAPSITSSATANRSEGQTAIMSVTATDPETDDIAWSITGGADDSFFAIDPATGALSFLAAPDYENALDADTDNIYIVEVTATDEGTNTDMQSISVTVTEANEAPTITSSATPSVVENQTAVLTATATDPETDTMAWSISGGADQALFDIDAGSGALTFLAAPDYEDAADADTNNTYIVEITANDGNSNTDAQTVTVTVTDDNEAPSITSAATANAAENQTAVMTAAATDPETDAVTWSITGGADSAFFDIVSGTGVLTFLAAPDYENELDAGGDNVYNVEVTATDIDSNTDMMAIAVTVTDDNEAPSITSLATASAAENQTAVMTTTATDPETDAVTWSITGGADAALFDIVAGTGVLTFLAAPDYENAGDVGTDNVYNVEVTATDIDSNTDMIAIAVTVTDDNEAPAITSAATANAAENQTAVMTATSTDPETDAVTWSITGGDDAALFDIVVGTGVLTFLAAPDYENEGDVGTDNVYNVEVTATDTDANTDMMAIAVTVTDDNEAPSITSAATANAAENQTAVLTAAATDPETDAVTWSITGGADSALFDIVAGTGVLTFLSAPDFENELDAGANNVYDVEVTATDIDSNTDMIAIAVTVTDANEDPAITSSDTPSVVENTTAVLTATATDPETDTVTWTISGGVDSAQFSIDTNSGALTFDAAPDFEAPTDTGPNNVYVVEINAHDGTNNIQQTVSVTVTDDNEAPSITSAATANAAENQTAVMTTAASDPETDAVTWSITGGADSALFDIVAGTGVLTFLAAPDYENEIDAGNDNVYNVEVTATDIDSNTDMMAIAVTVTDANEAPSITSAATANAVENQTAVMTATSTDPETDAVTWSITGGADELLFDIDSGTGVLTFTSAPDYENELDVGADNVYDVEITATDTNSNTDVMAVAVTVTDDNEAPAITSAATANTAENQTAVMTAAATDPETDAVTWSITGGADSAFFDIVSGTGVLTFLAAPDYENELDAGGDNVYNVEVTATDTDSNTDMMAIAVTVTAANEAPAITSAATANAAENQTAVLTATATDPETDAVTWSITGGADELLFDIVAGTGVLTFLAAPDYETAGDVGGNNVYDVEITATDASLNTDVMAIAVTVTDDNEAPTITTSGTVNAAENQTAVLTAAATDVDAGDDITWSITAGADAALFGIDSSTGVLTFNSAPNFESAGDAGGNNVYDIQITATDTDSNTDVLALAVTVTDDNEAPSITTSGTVNAAENQTAVLTAAATDVDAGDDITWSITAGADAGLFGIDSSTGVLTFNAAPNFEVAGDADTDNVYNVTITATDTDSNTDVLAIAVTVTDDNEAPSITTSGTVNAAENQTAVLTAAATEVDSGDSVAWTISGGADAALFGIVSTTGDLTFNSAPNFEAAGDAGTNNVYDVQITATDEDSNTDVLDLAVTVTDDNEAPSITTSGTVNAAENQTAVLTAAATDVDAGDDITWSITAGDDAALFGIDSSTGVLTFNAAPNFEVAGDTGGNNVYDLQITATDTDSNTDVLTLAVTVTDDNEAPAITTSATVNAAENQTAVLTAAATEVDSGDSVTWTITSGDDAALFGIDPSTGVLTFDAAPNFESPADVGTDNVYEVQITATDEDSNTDVLDLAVTVTDDNEAPTITTSGTVNAAENQTAVLTAAATDVDAGDDISWSITAGADAALFGIDSSTGVLTFNSAPNFEVAGDAGGNNVYDIQITATDTDSNTDVLALAVTVTDDNEAPSITTSGTVNAAENQTAVLTAAATDVDAGDDITWSITAGADAALFDIDSSTGVLTFNSAPNFEAAGDAGGNNVYDIQITATDTDSNTDVLALAVTVTDDNEAPSITTSGTVNAAENQTSVLTAAATDVDAGDDISWSITAGADAALFGIDSSTGVLTFNSAPDFEVAGDAGGNNVYDIQITATDTDSNTDVLALAVTVTDDNEAPSITTSGTVNAAENQTAVLTAAATDVDAGDDITWSISAGADAALFGIDSSTGVLTFNSAPNFEAAGDAGGNNVYDIQITATDTESNTDVLSLAVTVTDDNEAPSITTSGTVNAAENQTAVLTAAATEVDAGDSVAWTISGGADAALFGIVSGTGVLTFNSAPNFEIAGDAGGNNVYDIQITATDEDSNTDVLSLAVTVTDDNEAPSITTSGTVNAAENQTAVLTAAATDVDAGDDITWSITAGADAALFGIDSSTGVLTFNSAPNFEVAGDAGGNNVYDIQITATDTDSNTDVLALAVTVTDDNEAPSITTAGTVNAAENQTAVLTAAATEVDAGDSVSWTISGGADSALFGIVSTTGVLTFNSAPNFEIAGDAGGNNVYDIQLTATDEDSNTDVLNLAVTVTDDNEAPSITTSGTANVAENQTAVLTAAVTDVDAGDDITWSITGGADDTLFGIVPATGVLTFNSAPDFEAAGDAGTNNVYDVQITATDTNSNTDVLNLAVTVTDDNEAPSITTSGTVNAAENQTAVLTAAATDVDAGDDITWSITGGADDTLFGIVPTTGVLTFNSAPNFEAAGDAGTNNVYDVQITATDTDSNTDVLNLAVTVTDDNEAPSITTSGTVNAAENQTAVLTAAATDVDAGDDITWSITGGADDTLFGIVPTTGVLTFNSAPDFEAAGDAGGNNVYDVQITATDEGSNTDVLALAVTVTDDNEAPAITSSATANAAENQTGVMTVAATEPDAGDSLIWSITGGADELLFDIVPATGVLTFSSAPDFETTLDAGDNNVYNVEVTATDEDSNTDMIAIAVTVTNVAEAPILADAAAQNYTETLAITNLDFANTGFAAVDCDSSPTLPSGLQVTVSGTTCRISGTPDTATPVDTYTITATSDDTSQDTATVQITVVAAVPPALANLAAQVYTTGVLITPISFSNSGDDAVACDDTTPLPTGLAVGVSGGTCRITGTPSASTAAATYTIRATAADDTVDDATVNITINDAPTLSITEPSGTEVAEAGTYTITYTAADGDDPGATVALYYQLSASTGCSAGLSGWTEIDTGLALGTGVTQGAAPGADGTYYICGVVTDGDVTVYDVTSTTFYVNAQPEISFVQPMDNDDAISVDYTYTIAIDGYDFDDSASIDLYFHTVTTGCSGTPTAQGWTAVPSATGLAETTTTMAWTPSVAGAHYICARITDGIAANNAYAVSAALLVMPDLTFDTNVTALDSGATHNSGSPWVAVANNGTAMVVGNFTDFDQTDAGSDQDAVACYYDTSTWTCEALDPGVDGHATSKLDSAEVVADTAGNFVVAWVDYPPASTTSSFIRARRYLAGGGGWQASGATILASGATKPVVGNDGWLTAKNVTNQIAIAYSDNNGDGMIRRFLGTSGETWEAPEAIDSGLEIWYPMLDMAANGDLWVAFRVGATKTTASDLYVRQYDWSAVNWLAVSDRLVQGPTTAYDIGPIDVAVSPSNTYVSLGFPVRSMGTAAFRPFGAFYDGVSWDVQQLMSVPGEPGTPTTTSSSPVSTAVLDDGRALYAFSHDHDDDSTYTPFVTSNYQGTWEASPTQLATHSAARVTVDGTHYPLPRVSMGRSGAGVVTWANNSPKEAWARKLYGWTSGNLPDWAATTSERIDTGTVDLTNLGTSIVVGFNEMGSMGVASFVSGAAASTRVYYVNIID